MTDLNGEDQSSSKNLPELLLLNLQRIEAAVNEEYLENDRRLNWFLLFQAFLFQGYATALQATTGANAGHERQVAHAMALMVIIIAVGLITSGLTYVSTQAGIDAAEGLKQARENYRKEVEAQQIFTGGWFPKSDKKRLHDKGLMPTRWGPGVIIAAWVAVALHCTRTFVY